MLDYKLVEALARVIETGSFESAARQLHLTQSAVSQRVKLLEARSGKPLLIRSSPVRATPDGQQLLKHYRQVRLLESELEAADGGSAGGPIPLSVAVNADSIDSWFLPAVAEEALKRGWLLKLMVEDQDETLRLLKSGEVIGCVTAEPQPPQGCRACALGTMRYRCVATAGFSQRYFREGFGPETAIRAPAVVFNHKDRLHEEFLTRCFGSLQGDFPHHLLPSTTAFLAAISADMGYGLVPDLMLGDLIRSGKLVELQAGQNFGIELYWQCWGMDTPLVRELSDIVIAAGRKALLPTDRVR